jgi:hypothetical protein
MKNTFLLLLTLAGLTSFGQYSLTFCEDVGEGGKPVTESRVFMVDQSGGVMKMLLRADEKISTPQVEYRVFYIDDDGSEAEISRLKQKVETNWNFAWKEVVFYDPGSYKVKVYTDKGTYITSANVTIKKQ